jgi:hypothetical protein
MKILSEICGKMKRRYILLILAVLAVSACKKYEDGPLISLLPRRERIEGKWVASSVKINETDSMAAYKNHIWEFTRRYSVILQVNSAKYTGIWSTQTSDKDFVIDYDNGKREMYQILRLTNKEFWIRNKQSQLEFHLKPN